MVLAEVERRGARTLMFNGEALNLPLYSPQVSLRDEPSRALVEALRAADGVIIALSRLSHGTISGHVKNALDYIEDLSGDNRPYLDGRAVGCIAAASGWQAAVSTLVALRSVVHALRGWPTPFGMAVNSLEPIFEDSGVAREQCRQSLQTIAFQVLEFTQMRQGSIAA